MRIRSFILATALVSAISLQSAQAFEIPKDNSGKSSGPTFSLDSNSSSSFSSSKKGNFIEQARAMGNELVENASTQLDLVKDDVLQGIKKIGDSIK